MSILHFSPKEEARIGPYASCRGFIGRDCVVTKVLDPVCGMNRYEVEVDGQRVRVLETSLVKVWKRSDWQSLKCDWYGQTRQIWRPKREAR